MRASYEVSFFIRFKPLTLLEVHPVPNTAAPHLDIAEGLRFANSRELRRALIRAGIPSSVADVWGWRGPYSVTIEQLKSLGFAMQITANKPETS